MIITHRTYVAAECVACHKVARRFCLLHDNCEHGADDCKGHF